MEIRLLGLVEASYEGHAVALGGAKPRALLAILALAANTPVSADRLIEGLWGERPPATAQKAVQVLVSQLRKHLEGTGAGIVTRGRGYELRVDPEAVDALRFERLLTSSGNGSHAREALALWRGPPLDDLADEPFAAPEIRRLEDLWLGAREAAIDDALAGGRHAEVVGELAELVRVHPLRERLHGQRMLALYGCGRQAEALDAFRHARQVLLDQVGLEPGPELRRLNDAILRQDPELDGPALEPLDQAILTQSATPGALRESRLPVAPNHTFGREHELEALAERLRSRSVRLLTLTGPGGVGKTRVALEAARAVEVDFPDGARFVSLASVQRGQDVAGAIVSALGVSLLPGESAHQAAERFLAAKRLLLVADNFEQVLDAAPFIAGLLDGCPALTVLVTSREPLALHAEERHPVTPLALPGIGMATDLAALARADAVMLFCERAQAHDPEFHLDEGNATAVAEICRRVDGLPLAIELAAARCGLLSPREIAQRLDSALGALGSGPRDAPARQQTLRATVDWSHELLSAEEQACFAHFAVFAGAVTVEVAEAITDADLDTLDSLVAKSLLVRRRTPGGSTRLAMLQTVRAYAAERFAASTEAGTVRERHHRRYLALAQHHGADRALWGANHQQHLATLDASADDLHLALGRAIRDGSTEPALALCAALAWYWQIRDRNAEAAEWSEQALNLPRTDDHAELCIRVLSLRASALWALGRQDERAAVMIEAEARARALADPVHLSRLLATRAVFEALANRPDLADPFADEALSWAAASADDWTIAVAARVSALAARGSAQLHTRVGRASALLEQAGNLFHLAGMLASSAYTALSEGNVADASDYIGRALPIAQRLDIPHLWMLLRGNAALIALLTGDCDAAQRAFREELELCRELVFQPFVSEGLQGLAAVATVLRADRRAARLCGAAAAHRRVEADPVGARLEATFFAPARRRSGADAWDAAVRDGAALSFEDAIAYALAD